MSGTTGLHECASSHVPPDLACKEFLRGANDRCVYCDHEEKCHPGPGGTCWVFRPEEDERALRRVAGYEGVDSTGVGPWDRHLLLPVGEAIAPVTDKYDRYREGLIAGGVSEADADDAVAESKRGNECLDRLECPKCSAAMRCSVDPRQAGSSEISGVWHQFACTACGYRIDRKQEIL